MTFAEWKEDYGLVYEPNYCEGTEADCLAAFKAGSASRDAEVAECNRVVGLWIVERDKEAVRATVHAEERDQLRNQVAMLRHALIHTCSHTRIDSGFDRKLVDNALAETEPK